MGYNSKMAKRVISFVVICLLGLLVFYQGVQMNIQAAENNNTKDTSNKVLKPIKFKSFNEYVAYLKSLNLDKSTNNTTAFDGAKEYVDANTSSVNENAVADASSSSYGTTNIQVNGVDEADIIKNDGKYIYILNKNTNKVKIISALPANKMSLKGEINLQSSSDKNYRNYSDMYLNGNKLVIVYNLGVYQDRVGIMPIEINNVKIAPNYIINNKSFTCAEIYDISDKSKPRLERTVMNEGNYTSSRMIGNTLYLVSNKYLNLYGNEGSNPYSKDNLLVSYSDTKVDNSLKYAPIQSMYCILDEKNPYNMQNISIISSVDISKSEEFIVSSFTGTGYNVYMSLENLYIFGQSWDMNTSYTDIYKYKLDGTAISFAASNKVAGYMLNQFSADEYSGNLRIATTEWNNGNHLYILDKDLQKIGEIKGIAKGEQIKSCRFMQEKGYIVTYETVDPLFVLDLSNPKKPSVTGELKIPGFSSYLHPVSENLIVGVGENTTPLYWKDENGKEIESGVKQIGIKVSLFDVSNEAKPVEVKSISIGGPGSYTDIGYDHKAFMFIKEKSLIAIRGSFTPKPENGIESYEYKSQAILISVEPKNIEIEKILDGHFSYETGNRVTYIGDTLYHFTGSELIAYNINSYAKLSSIEYN